MQPAFAAETAFFLAAGGTGRIEFVEGIRPDYAGAQFVHDLENSAISLLDGSAEQVAR